MYKTRIMFRRSSAVEQLTVNQFVVGSIPTAGANHPRPKAIWVAKKIELQSSFKKY